MDQGRFSVCRYTEDGRCQDISKAVDLDTAVETFARQVSGDWTKHVVITNGQISVEWTIGGGIRKAVTG